MNLRCGPTKPAHKLVATGLLCTLLIACTTVGPDAIRGGRLVYNEAINETNNQQLLMVPVHTRYEESNHLLAVGSVTANMRISSSAGVQAGFGDSDNYSGNLVPFSGRFIYEENPTISYTPVTGETYLQQLATPIPVSLLAHLSQSLPYPEFAYRMMISSVNGIHNPSFLFDQQQDDPRFEQLVALMTALTREHCLYWVEDSRDGESFSLVLDPSKPEHIAAINDLLQLLGLSAMELPGTRQVIPVSLARNDADQNGIAITTKAIWDLVQILSAAVEIPPEDRESGVATSFPRLGRAGRDIQIRYASYSPEQAYVAVEHHDGWFYIDNHDLATKRYFKLLGSLWSASVAKSLGNGQAGPVLTVPVSR